MRLSERAIKNDHIWMSDLEGEINGNIKVIRRTW